MRRSRLAGIALALLPFPAAAQRVTDNAVASAEDAFGSSIGNERVGLYSSAEVRGFSPVTANNIRLEGLYFDRPAAFTDRLVSGNVIRVGLTAQTYLFPAPTGIVDYRLRPAGDRRVVSTVFGYGPNGGGRVEVDGQFPIVAGRLSLVAGAAVFDDRYASGGDAFLASYALAPRWRPAAGVEITPFWSRIDTWGRDATPIYATEGSFLPGPVVRGRYPGPRWADQRGIVTHSGGIATARPGGGWALAGGLFRSVTESPRNHAAIFAALRPDGTAVQRITRDPVQRIGSTSGEARISRTLAGRDRIHALHLSYRARDRRSAYGGGRAVEFGRVAVDAAPRPVEPDIATGTATAERVTQHTLGVGYDGRWRRVGSLSLGVQRTDYRKRVDRPGVAPARTHDPAWLYNGTLAIEATRRLAFYGSYTRGLEESGIAPDSAANRTQALPAILTTQADAGLRWKLGAMTLVAGGFDVRKPYFAADARNVFTELGAVRHRGAELSLAGTAAPGLTLVAGAVLMRPRVTGAAVADGRVGRRPVGQAARLLTASGQYAVPGLDGFSLTLNVQHQGARPGDTPNLVTVPGQAILDAGIRHRFALGRTPALLRFQVTNLTDRFAWQVAGSNSYQVNAPRTATLFLTMDL